MFWPVSSHQFKTCKKHIRTWNELRSVFRFESLIIREREKILALLKCWDYLLKFLKPLCKLKGPNNVVCILLKQLNVWEILFHPMFSPNSLAAINNCKIRLSLWKRQLLSQNPFKVNARKIFGKFNPLVWTFVSQHTILQRTEGRIESGSRAELNNILQAIFLARPCPASEWKQPSQPQLNIFLADFVN